MTTSSSSSSNTAIVVDQSGGDRFVLRDAPAPQPLPTEAVIAVKAISVNPGEIRNAAAKPTGSRIGWDFSGVVETPAADGSGPMTGTRVVGMVPTAAWARRIAAPTHAIAELPDAISFAQASTLPVAGLTALHALYKGGFLLGKSVLITGATGGTGMFACQLAKLAGAKVVATVRSQERAAFVEKMGAAHVVVGEDPSGAEKFGPYRLIIDSVGGDHFSKVLGMLASKGTCVIFGTMAGPEPKIDARKFYSTGETTLYGMIVFKELIHEPASIGLRTLVDLLAAKKIVTQVDVEEPWTNVADVAKRLQNRQFVGKAVLQVE